MDTLGKAFGLIKEMVEQFVCFYLFSVVLAALTFMSAEFLKIFFSFSWDSSLTSGSKLFLALGWILFPSMFYILSKGIGTLAIRRSLYSKRTPIPWKVARAISKNTSQTALRNS